MHPAPATCRVIPFRRPGAAKDADLAASLETCTRRGDVIGELLRAAQAPSRGCRPAKVRDGDLRSVEAVRREQAAAWLGALIEIADHGTTPELLSAMLTLVSTMDGRLRDRAQERLDAIENGEPVADVAELRVKLARMRRAGSPPPPPSGPVVLLARDPRYVALRREALDALGAVTGDLAPGVRSLGGLYAPGKSGSDLAQMARELDVEACHPSRGNVARMARQAAVQALAMAERVPGLRAKAEAAAGLLERLATMAEQGGVK